jgi:simple sugar transport system ATP-binding protein
MTAVPHVTDQDQVREAPALELVGITKRFGHLRANDGISLEVAKGEVLGLLGENGAGKSTLMNIVYGLYQPDDGTIRVDGVTEDVGSPIRAVQLGIGMVHQHFMLVPDMTVAENIAVSPSRLPGRARLQEVKRRLEAIAGQYGLEVDPDAVIADLPLGARQRVEIVKLLYRGADILILDEPTAALSDDEWLQLAEFLKELKAQGKSVVFITHKLEELFGVADRCTVLRHGKVVGTVAMRGTDKAELARMMVGRDVVLERSRVSAPLGDPIFTMEGVVVEGDDGRKLLEDINLQVRAGEIVGVAGVGGNGQDTLVEVVSGARPIDGGRMQFAGKDCARFSPADFGRRGGALIPADRHAEGMAAELSVIDNLIARDLELGRFVRRGMLDVNGAREHCETLREEFDIRCSSLEAPMRELSGGNQQKAVFARELGRGPRFLVAAEPTRGLDVGAAEYVYRRLNERKQAGAGIILISSELDEIMSLADRIVVMVDGRMSEARDAASHSRESIGLLMAGEGMAAR